MITDTAPAPAATGPALADDELHVICPCSPNVSLCGFDDMVELEYVDAEGAVITCVVCADLDEQPCPRCGG